MKEIVPSAGRVVEGVLVDSIPTGARDVREEPRVSRVCQNCGTVPRGRHEPAGNGVCFETAAETYYHTFFEGRY